MTKPLLQSILDELRRLIQRDEADYADLVMSDLNDAIQSSSRPIKTAYEWLKKYKSLS
ncbi:MAG: hypothetical protein AAFV93_09575 [Chloroflexota bacterium]